MLTLRYIFLELVGNAVDIQARLLFFNGSIFFLCKGSTLAGVVECTGCEGLMGCFMRLKLPPCTGLNFTLLMFLLNPMQIQYSTFPSSQLQTTYLYFFANSPKP